MQMKVAKGCSAMDMNRNVMVEGTVFTVVERRPSAPKGQKIQYGPLEVIKSTVDDWVASGHCVPLRDGEMSVPNPNTDQIVRTPAPITLPSPNDVDGQNIAPQITEVTQNGVSHAGSGTAPGVVLPSAAPPPAANPPVNSPISPWMFDPATLEGKTVEEGNAMIAERLSPEAQAVFIPLQSLPEIIRYLSMDFGAQVSATPVVQGSVQVARQEE